MKKEIVGHSNASRVFVAKSKKKNFNKILFFLIIFHFYILFMCCFHFFFPLKLFNQKLLIGILSFANVSETEM